MKSLFALALSFLISTPASAAVSVNTECGMNYGPSATNLALSDDMDDFIQVGYITMGVFFPIKVGGCKDVKRDGQQLLCDGKVVGSLGKFESTNDDGGVPRADLTIDSKVNASITGSCGRGKEPLKITFEK